MAESTSSFLASTGDTDDTEPVAVSFTSNVPISNLLGSRVEHRGDPSSYDINHPDSTAQSLQPDLLSGLDSGTYVCYNAVWAKSECSATANLTSFDDYSQLRDFSVFVENVGLNLDWNFDPELAALVHDYEMQVPQPDGGQRIATDDRERSLVPNIPDTVPQRAVTDAMNHGLPSATSSSTVLDRSFRAQQDQERDDPRMCSSLLSLIFIDLFTVPLPQAGRHRCSWQVTDDQRAHLESLLLPFRNLIGDLVLPSRYTLTRYIQGYVEGFHKHLPLLHIPTLQLDKFAPELALALCAAGAQYRFESAKAIPLFYAAKAIVFERIRRRDDEFQKSLMREVSQHPAQSEGFHDSVAPMQTVRAILFLTTFAAWEHNPGVLKESFDLQSLLARCVRENGLIESMEVPDMDWQSWAEAECDRRTKFVVFCLSNLQTVAYNLPPSIMTNEIDLRLPCPAEEWAAEDSSSWIKLRQRSTRSNASFRDSLTSYYENQKEPRRGNSPFGNYILLHALIQKIWSLDQHSDATIIGPNDPETDLLNRTE